HIAGACGGDEDRPPPPPAPPLLPFPDVTQHFLKHQNHFNPPYGIEGEYEEDAQELVAAGASGNGGIWGCIPATDNPESPSARTGYYDPITGGFAIVQFEEIKTYFPINISQWDRFCDRGQT
ncbi:MAG: hypothetical protein ACREEO_01660, partial [Phenylobacterium sp.]